MLLNRISIFVIFLLLISGKLYAQSTPCTTLGQNPQTAFPVCGTAVFKQDSVPVCGGRNIATPCNDGPEYSDLNPFWYKFTCFTSGKLSFFITPDSIFEDYDWQLFDVTGKDPQDVYIDTSTFVACSWSGIPGITGASEDSGGVSLTECLGPARNRFTSLPDLVAGHNYLLLVSHYENTQFGYSLSFGGVGSTAVITDALPPHMFTANRATCDGSKILVKLNKKMRCSSLAANGSDFQITPPMANITSAVGVGCTGAFDMDSVLLTFNIPLPIGNYNLIAKIGTDTNTIVDLCNNGIPVNETIPFTVLSPFPVPFDSVTNNRCSTDSVILVFPDLIKCGSVAADGSDFFVTGPYPVSITNAVPVNCIGALTKKIVVHFNATLFQPGNFQIILKVGRDGNTLLSECDTASIAGSAIPFKIMPKPVANFAFPDTVCLPQANIIFKNNSSITDGSENAFRYLWNFDDPSSGGNNISTQKSPTHFYTGTGPFNVRLKVTSNAGCIKDTNISVNSIHAQPQINFGISKKNICLEDAVFLTDSTKNTDGYLKYWYWDLGDGKIKNTQNVLYIYKAAGVYDISLYTVSNYGCKSETLSKTIHVYAYPTADAGPDRRMLEGSVITIQASAGGENLKYAWSPSQYLNDSTVMKPKCADAKFDILYTLTVTGAAGCATTDDMFVDVLKNPHIPNTFSPNNDGKNDTWKIEYLDEYTANHLQVFTRTGQKIFESRGPYKAWDGTYKGKPLPMDTYYYIIEPGDGQDPVTGYVTIVK